MAASSEGVKSGFTDSEASRSLTEVKASTHFFSFFSSMFRSDHLAQSILVKQSIAISQILKTRPFNQEGICDDLCSLYIRYSRAGRQAEFFKKIQQINTCSTLNEVTIEAFKSFYLELSKNWFSTHVEDTSCYDAFTFSVSSVTMLQSFLRQIITSLQQHGQTMYVKISLSHLHSIVLEQRQIPEGFSYTIYDPNNDELPLELQSVESILSVLKGILSLRWLLILPTSIIFTCNVYKTVQSADDAPLSAIMSKINSLRAESYSPLLDDIQLIIKRYQQNWDSRGVLLSNLLLLFKRADWTDEFNFNDEIEVIEQELQGHMLSTQFLHASSFSKAWNGLTLLHEVARLGDLDSLMTTLKFSDSFTHFNDMTALECAIGEGHILAMVFILEHRKDVDRKTFDERLICGYLNCYMRSSSRGFHAAVRDDSMHESFMRMMNLTRRPPRACLDNSSSACLAASSSGL